MPSESEWISGAHVKQAKIYSCNSSRNAFTCRHWFAFTQFMRTQDEGSRKKTSENEEKNDEGECEGETFWLDAGRKWNSFRLLICNARSLLFIVCTALQDVLAANGQHFGTLISSFLTGNRHGHSCSVTIAPSHRARDGRETQAMRMTTIIYCTRFSFLSAWLAARAYFPFSHEKIYSLLVYAWEGDSNSVVCVCDSQTKLYF